jgi:hypothetical protein
MHKSVGALLRRSTLTKKEATFCHQTSKGFTQMRTPTQDSLDRDAFVDALIEYARLNQNQGFTSAELFDYFDTLHLAKSTTRNNDFVTTAQKAAQDWGFRLFRQGNLYYVNNRTARYFRFPCRKPPTAKEYSASRRGYSRRQQRNH